MDVEYIFEPVKTDKRIGQAEISFGEFSQHTYLATCISIVVFSDEKRIGGLSHIVGRKTNIGPFPMPQETIDQLKIHIVNYCIIDPRYYIVGGMANCKHILEMTEGVLRMNRIEYDKVDVLGEKYRNIFLLPEERKLKILKFDPPIKLKDAS